MALRCNAHITFGRLVHFCVIRSQVVGIDRYVCVCVCVKQAKDTLKTEMLGQVDTLLLHLRKELEELAKAEASAAATTAPPPPASSSPSDLTESEGASGKEDGEEANEAGIETKGRDFADTLCETNWGLIVYSRSR